MARGLTHKETVFVKEKAKGKSGVAAALIAYDTTDYNTASMIASENLSKPKIVKALADRIPDDLLEKVHLEGLQATTIKFTPEGEMIQNTDFFTRHKYLDAAYKLKGSYAPEKSMRLNVETTIDNPEADKLRQEYENKLKESLLVSKEDV